MFNNIYCGSSATKNVQDNNNDKDHDYEFNQKCDEIQDAKTAIKIECNHPRSCGSSGNTNNVCICKTPMKSIKIATHNVLVQCWMSYFGTQVYEILKKINVGYRLTLVANRLAKIDADVIALQEMTNFARSVFMKNQTLRETYYMSKLSYTKSSANVRNGTVIMIKKSLVCPLHVCEYCINNFLFQPKVLNGASASASTSEFNEKDLSAAMILKWRGFNLASIHLDWPGCGGDNQLVHLVDDFHGIPSILVGDFNQNVDRLNESSSIKKFLLPTTMSANISNSSSAASGGNGLNDTSVASCKEDNTCFTLNDDGSMHLDHLFASATLNAKVTRLVDETRHDYNVCIEVGKAAVEIYQKMSELCKSHEKVMTCTTANNTKISTSATVSVSTTTDTKTTANVGIDVDVYANATAIFYAISGALSLNILDDGSASQAIISKFATLKSLSDLDIVLQVKEILVDVLNVLVHQQKSKSETNITKISAMATLLYSIMYRFGSDHLPCVFIVEL